jgi:hypothetical protein
LPYPFFVLVLKARILCLHKFLFFVKIFWMARSPGISAAVVHGESQLQEAKDDQSFEDQQMHFDVP